MDKLALTPVLRLLAAAAGASLLAAASRRRTFADTGLGLGGVGLLLLAFVSPDRPVEEPRDIVEIASEESFPASDSPAW